MKTSVSRACAIALTGTTIFAMGLVAPAHADRRGAPIVFAGSQAPQAAEPKEITPNTEQPAPAITANRRVAFEYPGQTAIAAPSKPSNPAQPSSTPFSFDPTKTQTRSVAPSQPIRIASVQAQDPARTGQPLTLSRVRSNRDAEIREERGQASIYMDGFDGQPTANGEIFDETAMTAAHPSLPLPSLVQVINEENGREIVVRVNDRGPFDGKRILELSPRAGSVLGMASAGSASVRLRYLGPAPVQQNPETFAAATVENESLPPVSVAPQPEILSASRPTLPAARPDPVQVSSMSVSAVRTGNIFIQAGAFSDIANAQNLTSNIGARLPVKIEEARVNGGDFFRVLVGPFSNRDIAERERQQLSRSGIVDGFLTTR